MNSFLSKSVGPAAMLFPEKELKDFMIDDCAEHNFIWTLMQYQAILQTIANCTEFHTEMCGDVPILKITVGDLDYTNASATDMSTIYCVDYDYISCVLLIFPCSKKSSMYCMHTSLIFRYFTERQ